MKKNAEVVIVRLIRLNEVIKVTGLSRSTIYSYIADNLFPRAVPLGERAVAWVESEVNDWVIARVEERDSNKPALSLTSQS